ncbi:MAG: hypothetical protein JWO68_3823 [Actinomycetia bacterium]|nr:hypothetical protein [Actinomycetes bacterium]
MDSAQLDRVLADDYVGDVTALPMEDLRAKRTECQAMEVGLSYQRRMAQGRLDIVAAEQRRRAEGGPAPDPDDLVRNLAATLADRQRPPGNGRLPQLMAPEATEVDTDELDAIAGPGTLVRLAEVSDADLAALVEGVSAYEHDVSGRRRSLHERIDALQAEITRRYRTGEASVETLLR